MEESQWRDSWPELNFGPNLSISSDICDTFTVSLGDIIEKSILSDLVLDLGKVVLSSELPRGLVLPFELDCSRAQRSFKRSFVMLV
jgi:hypothetical protein